MPSHNRIALSTIILGLCHDTQGQLGSKDKLFEKYTDMEDPTTIDSKSEDLCVDKTMCDACKNNFLGCEDIQAQCEKSICDPICLRSAWSVTTKAAGCGGWDGCDAFSAQVESSGTQRALSGQFKGAACGTKYSWALKCCSQTEKTAMDWMARWVEERTYAGMFPHGGIPIEACFHDPFDEDWKGCDSCKSAISVEAESNDSHWPDPPDNDGKGEQKPEPSEADMAFTNSEQVGAEQVPAFKSYQYRHEEFKTYFDGKKGALVAKFKEAACTCLGCCDEDDSVLDGQSCFFPVFANMEPGTLS